MRSRFLIIVVFAIVMQNSLAMQTTTSIQNHSDMLSDFSTTGAFKKVAYLEYQKVVYIIFTYLTELTSVAYGDHNQPGGSSFARNISESEVPTALRMRLDVHLLAIQSICHDTHSTIPTAQKTGYSKVQKFVDNISKAIGLIWSKHSYGNLTELKILRNESATAAPSLNTEIYNAMRCGRSNSPKIDAVIGSAQKKSTVQISIAHDSMYTAIEAVLNANTSQTGAERKSVFSTIKSSWIQASLALKTEIDINFGLIENFLLGLFVIQSGFKTDSSLIEAIKIAATSDYEKAMNTQDGSTELTSGNKNGVLADAAAIENAEKIALREFQAATSLIFTTINLAYDYVADEGQCGSEDDFSVSQITSTQILAGFKSIINLYFNATEIAQPKASATVKRVRQATYAELIEGSKGVQAGIELINSKNSTEIVAKLNDLEKTTTTAVAAVIKNVFIVIVNAQEFQYQTGTAIERLRGQAIFLIIKVFQTIFIGIKILLAQAFPEYRPEGENCFSSIEAVQTETSLLIMAVIETIFSAIRILFMASSNHQIELKEYSCPCAHAYW